MPLRALLKTGCVKLGPPWGQSLVEFVLVMPILVLILVGGFSLGIGTYEAHMASDAIQKTAMNKLTIADMAGAVPAGSLIGYANAGGSGTLKTGSPIDQLQIVSIDPYTSLVLGTKNFVPPAAFLPGFRISVSQVINGKLMQSAHSGAAEIRPYGTPWVPGGTPVIPPWCDTTNTDSNC